MLPNFLIIGAPRSGTTWLAKNLMEHPQIYVPRCKEVHFFDRHYEEGVTWYEKHFRGVSREAVIGEGTPAYLAHPDAAQRIRQDLGEIKLIAILRNPVDRLYSRHCNAAGKHKSQRTITFEERIRENHQLVEEGYYFDHLSRYLELFSRSLLNVSFYEDLRDNPVEFLRQIFSFLCVGEDFSPVATRHVLNAAAAKPLNAVSSSLYYLQRAVRRIGLATIAEQINHINRRETPAMAPNTREWLINDVYGEKNNRLAELLEVDLSQWNTF